MPPNHPTTGPLGEERLTIRTVTPSELGIGIPWSVLHGSPAYQNYSAAKQDWAGFLRRHGIDPDAGKRIEL